MARAERLTWSYGARDAAGRMDGAGLHRSVEIQRHRFDQLSRAARPTLLAVALRICKRDQATAEDLLQEALLRAWNNFAALQDEARMIPWLVRIMRNCWIDLCRKHTKHPTVSEIPDQATSVEEPSPWQRISVDDFRRAVERLEEPYRTVVMLRDVDGLTNEEISLRTGAPYATVATRVHRAHKQLKDILQRALNAKEE